MLRSSKPGAKNHPFGCFFSAVTVADGLEVIAGESQVDAAGMGDCVLKESFRVFAGHEQGYVCSASGFTEDGYIFRIASKSLRICLHPFQRLDQVEHGEVGSVREVLTAFHI